MNERETQRKGMDGGRHMEWTRKNENYLKNIESQWSENTEYHAHTFLSFQFFSL